MRTIDERNVDPIQEMMRIAQNFMDLNSWGFKESYRSAKSGILIYDSEWCRVNFLWGGWDYLGGNSISVFYGRLHAPNEKSTMICDDEECHCWHGFEHALHFLDGRTPPDAAKMDLAHSLTDPFYEIEFRQKFRRRQPEWLAQMNTVVWQHYGKRFFNLFDLRQPQLWEQYRKFLKEMYDIKGRSPNIKPPLDKVC
jgi:hypothetical protein